MKHYLETAESVLDSLQSTKTGLTKQEAEARLAKYGENRHSRRVSSNSSKIR